MVWHITELKACGDCYNLRYSYTSYSSSTCGNAVQSVFSLIEITIAANINMLFVLVLYDNE
jgi:hypothetical protein